MQGLTLLRLLCHAGALARQPLAGVFGRVVVFGLGRTHSRSAAGIGSGIDVGVLVPPFLPCRCCSQRHPQLSELSARFIHLSVRTASTILTRLILLYDTTAACPPKPSY